MSLLRSSAFVPSPLRCRAPQSGVVRRRILRQIKRQLPIRASADPVDRALGSVPYLLPLMDGLRYGTYLFNAYPLFQRIVSPVFPLYNVYSSLPFGPLLFFFGIYFGIVRNRSLSRFVRFNAMQAILIDILLILPGFLIQVLRMSSEVRVPVYNVTWMYVFVCTAIGIMAYVYSPSRPLHAEEPQVPVHQEMEDYAHGIELQSIMQEMLTAVVLDRPADPIPFMIAFLQSKRKTNIASTEETKNQGSISETVSIE